MTRRMVQRLACRKKHWLFVAGWMVLGGTLVAYPGGSARAWAQATGADGKRMAFDVVSIRQDKTGGPTHLGATADGFKATNLPLIGLLQMAYLPAGGGDASFFTGSRILGSPDWFNGTEHYDVEAKVAESDLTEWKKPASQPAMLRAMLQELLEERCKLVVHREMKETAIYALVIGKGGPKLKPAETVDPAELQQKHPGSFPVPGGAVLVQGGGGRYSFYGGSTVLLTQLLSNIAGRPVQDQTGLTGRYDYTLQWTPDRSPAPGDSSPAPDVGPSIFTAVQEQLGLKLESEKSQVEILVIDHVERPSEN